MYSFFESCVLFVRLDRVSSALDTPLTSLTQAHKASAETWQEMEMKMQSKISSLTASLADIETAHGAEIDALTQVHYNPHFV
jgi:hypothetical protein